MKLKFYINLFHRSSQLSTSVIVRLVTPDHQNLPVRSRPPPDLIIIARSEIDESPGSALASSAVRNKRIINNYRVRSSSSSESFRPIRASGPWSIRGERPRDPWTRRHARRFYILARHRGTREYTRTQRLVDRQNVRRDAEERSIGKKRSGAIYCTFRTRGQGGQRHRSLPLAPRDILSSRHTAPRGGPGPRCTRRFRIYIPPASLRAPWAFLFGSFFLTERYHAAISIFSRYYQINVAKTKARRALASLRISPFASLSDS